MFNVLRLMRPAHRPVPRPPEVMSPFSDGARVGRLGLSPSLNPHPFGSDAYKAWYQGWFSEISQAAARRVA